MKRSNTPIRRTPVRKVKPGIRRGQPTKAEKEEARRQCCNRAGEKCESCGIPLPLELGHLAHEHAKRRFGWQESETNSHKWLCFKCHHEEHSPKACPPKAGLL